MYFDALAIPTSAARLRGVSRCHSTLVETRMSDCPSFRDILVRREHIPGEVTPGPAAMGGVALARQRAPAHVFERGPTSDLVIVAQQNIASTSVEFDLGYGWREHFCPAAAAIYVIPAQADARWRLDGESQCVYLAMAQGQAYALLDELHVARPDERLWDLASRGFEEPVVHELLVRLWQEASCVGPNPLLGSSCRVAILHALARYSQASRRAAARTVPKLSRIALQRVLAAIHEMPPDGLSVEQLASVAGLSPFHFSRLFRNSVGCSPYRYYDKLRHERARELLASTALSIEAIARQLGFADASQLGRAFRRHAGCSPGAYRAQVGRQPTSGLSADRSA